jgi:hypothetical protein
MYSLKNKAAPGAAPFLGLNGGINRIWLRNMAKNGRRTPLFAVGIDSALPRTTKQGDKRI